jgi:uncharacterized integral membrane protein
MATDLDDRAEPTQADRQIDIFSCLRYKWRTPDAATKLDKLDLWNRGGAAMRWLHVIVVALFVIATCIFAIQNFEIVTLSFLGFSARAPLALLIAIFYLLGMATGGSLFALLRRSIARSRFNATNKT